MKQVIVLVSMIIVGLVIFVGINGIGTAGNTLSDNSTDHAGSINDMISTEGHWHTVPTTDDYWYNWE